MKAHPAYECPLERTPDPITLFVTQGIDGIDLGRLQRHPAVGLNVFLRHGENESIYIVGHIDPCWGESSARDELPAAQENFGCE